MSKEQEIKKLKERIQELECIKDFQQDIIVEFEKVTGKELSKVFARSLSKRDTTKEKKLSK
ncbi:MAG: hypothetical protein HWD58_18685 [Bacteroidota bacterium]|nr:MAG: hypothetical protein HWD58_18520 [Bacteroidota bacterium]QLH47467.1 MAG: hypothetical protein HWD58_18685 [Bacteroidota bacterium]